jgi:monoamine oxidase
LKEGTQAISVFLSKQIKHIEYNEEGSIVTAIKDSKVIKFQSKKTVLAFSPTLYSKISFSPPLPYIKSSLCENLPMGTIIKTNTFYKNAFWRNKGLNGQFLSRNG